MAADRRSRRRVVSAVVLVVVLAVIGALVGVASAVLRGPTFTSSSQLLWDPTVRAGIDPTFSPPDSQAFDRQVADQQDVVLSDAVVGRVSRALGEPAAQVRDAVSVVATSGSAAFTIDATASSASQARGVARATTSAYIATLQARNETLLQTRVTALTAQATTLRRQLASSTGSAIGQSLADVQTQLSAAQAALADVPVEATVQRVATVPTSPSSLSTAVQAVVGGGLGAVLAVCVLLALWTRSQRRSPSWVATPSAGHAAPAAAVGASAAAHAVAPAPAPVRSPAQVPPAPVRTTEEPALRAPADDLPYFEDDDAARPASGATDPRGTAVSADERPAGGGAVPEDAAQEESPVVDSPAGEPAPQDRGPRDAEPEEPAREDSVVTPGAPAREESAAVHSVSPGTSPIPVRPAAG